jgi:2-polyprenyl-3-methyl-5-hydroxy-6-metoxy-1,4-benzoquinol methylase
MLSEIVQSRRRVLVKELMDEPCSEAECCRCLRDLSKVNRTLFVYRPTLRWLQQFTDATTRQLHIVDVGCGAGDMLRRIEQWALKKGIAVRLTGIDRNPSAVEAARRLSRSSRAIEWVNCEALKFQPGMRIDLVISSHFTHHLDDAEIIQFLQWMETVAARGWFISDLERSIASYYEFKLLAQVMRWHPFVRHDGPVSILRSFTHKDWKEYIVRAGLELRHVGIFRSWPGRLCVSRVK